MKKTFLLFAATTLLAVAACENEIDIHTEGEQQQLSLHGYLSADSAVNRIVVAMTGVKEATIVHQPSVEVYVNGEFREKCCEEDNERGRHVVITTPFHPGDRVRIEVTTPDGKYHAFVEETVPQPIEGIKALTEKYVENYKVLNEFGYEDHTTDVHQLRISFADNPNSTDFYRVATLVNAEELSYNYDPELGYQEEIRMVRAPWTFDCTQDPILMEGHTITPNSDFDIPTMGNVINRYGVFNDLLFMNREATITIYLPEHNNTYDYSDFGPVMDKRIAEGDATVVVESITQSEYYYLKTLNTSESEIYDENSDLTGPIRLPSNVHGGTGLVGFSSSKSMSVKIVKPQQDEILYY